MLVPRGRSGSAILPVEGAVILRFLVSDNAMTETPTIRLDGRLDTRTVPAAWREAMAVLRRHSAVSVVVDAAAVDYCDGAGVALLLHLLSQRRPNGAAVTLQGLAPKYQALLAQFKLDDCRALDELAGGVKAESLPNRVGRITYAMWRDLREMVEFTGECLAACARVVVRPTRVRWGDVLSEVSVSPARLVWLRRTTVVSRWPGAARPRWPRASTPP